MTVDPSTHPVHGDHEEERDTCSCDCCAEEGGCSCATCTCEGCTCPTCDHGQAA